MPEVQPSLDSVTILEKGFVSLYERLNSDEQAELFNRLAGRFGWHKAGELAVAEAVKFELGREDYDLTVTALADLGVTGTKKYPIPEHAALVEAMDTSTLGYLDSHTARGDKPELTFHLPFHRGLDFHKLVANFDRKQDYPTYPWNELWDSYDLAQHKFGKEVDTKPVAAIALNDTSNPENRSQPANQYDEAGLVHVDKTVKEQREALKAEQSAAQALGVDLDPMTLSQYIVLQAKRRQAGLPLLDRPTFTRFVQYPERQIGSRVCVPGADVYGDGRLNLHGSVVGSAWVGSGVRRAVRVV